jgi:hypothetical protein
MKARFIDLVPVIGLIGVVTVIAWLVLSTL